MPTDHICGILSESGGAVVQPIAEGSPGSTSITVLKTPCGGLTQMPNSVGVIVGVFAPLTGRGVIVAVGFGVRVLSGVEMVIVDSMCGELVAVAVKVRVGRKVAVTNGNGVMEEVGVGVVRNPSQLTSSSAIRARNL